MDIKKFDITRLSGRRIFDRNLIGYDDSIDIIRDEIHNVRKSFVKIGWYLKHINEKEMFRRDGYEDIYEFAHAIFKMSEGTVNRMINLCINFSVGNDSPELDERYQGFEASQLFEMLPMNESEREEISPDMTVKQIREKKAENRAAKEPSEALVGTFLKGRDIDLDDYETISELKKALTDMYGKSHVSGNCPCKFECTPRGISLKNHDEITWLAFARKAWNAKATEPAEPSEVQDAGDSITSDAASDVIKPVQMGAHSQADVPDMEPAEPVRKKEGAASGRRDCVSLTEEACDLSRKLYEGFRDSAQNHTLSEMDRYKGWALSLSNIVNELYELRKNEGK